MSIGVHGERHDDLTAEHELKLVPETVAVELDRYIPPPCERVAQIIQQPPYAFGRKMWWDWKEEVRSVLHLLRGTGAVWVMVGPCYSIAHGTYSLMTVVKYGSPGTIADSIQADPSPTDREMIVSVVPATSKP